MLGFVVVADRHAYPSTRGRGCRDGLWAASSPRYSISAHVLSTLRATRCQSRERARARALHPDWFSPWPSILDDLEAGRRTEGEHTIGDLVRPGRSAWARGSSIAGGPLQLGSLRRPSAEIVTVLAVGDGVRRDVFASQGEPMSQTRRLAAILAADVAGYSRLMGGDEEGTLERLKALRRELFDPKITKHHGRIVKTTGDGLLVEFASVVDAVRCAVEVQQEMPERNTGVGADNRIELRIGINLGDVIVEGDDLYGDGVNIAARLEALAEPGGICISRMVREQIRDKLPYPFADMGEQSVKNIARPVRAYSMSSAALAALPAVARPVETAKNKREIGEPITAVTPRLSIVVLPFANLSNDPEQEYFADGITDDLTTDLSRIPDALVIARSTAFTYKGKSVDAKQIGRELGVRYLLDGSVRRTADQVRVNVQLIDAEGGVQLWADRFDTDRANLAAAQDEITGRLARTFNLELVKDLGRRIEQEGAVDPDARDLVMRGWAWYHRPRSATTLREAQGAFERALEIEPGSVDARIGAASILAVTLANGRSRSVEQDHPAPNCYSLKPSNATRSARWRISRWGSSADFRTD